MLTASDSRNREHAKAHALWPLLLCIAVALRRRLVLVACFFLYVWWCYVVLRVLVFVALCCVHGVVCVSGVFFVGGVDGCLCFSGVGVHGVLDGLMGATVVLLGVSRDAHQNHCRAHHAIRKRYYVFIKHISSHWKPLSSHFEPLKATVEPLRAIAKPRSFFKFQVRSTRSCTPQNASSSNIGSMKAVVGEGYHLRTLNARVVNIVCDRQRRQKKNAEPLTAQKDHDEPPEPLQSHREHYQHFVIGQGLDICGQAPARDDSFSRVRFASQQPMNMTSLVHTLWEARLARNLLEEYSCHANNGCIGVICRGEP